MPPVGDKDEIDFDSLVRFGDESDDQIETPEGEEGQDGGEGPDESEEESGHAEEQDEGEDSEERQDLLDAVDEPAPNHKQRRSSKRWEQTQTELEETRSKLREAEGRLQRQQEQEQRENATRQRQLQEEEEDRLARMTTEERNQYEIQKLRNDVQYGEQKRAFDLWDSQDKADYRSIANSDSAMGRLFKKNEATIEKHLQDCRARNTNMPRHVLLRYEIGDQVLKAMANNKPSNPKPTRKTPKPPTSRGDASRTPSRSNPSSEREERRKRLENVRL